MPRCLIEMIGVVGLSMETYMRREQLLGRGAGFIGAGTLQIYC